MADALSIGAILGLAYLGRKITEKPEIPTREEQMNRVNQVNQVNQDKRPNFGNFMSEKYEAPSFATVEPDRFNFDFSGFARDRPYISGQMNNLSPVQKQLVGPGLGVGPNVPSFGGYQQLYRVNPVNVGAYKLTTLPGRSGPAIDVKGGRRQNFGIIYHNKPEKTAYLPDRLPNVPGRAQGQGGSLDAVTMRGKYEKTKRPTARSETTFRGDGLGYGPAKKVVSAGTLVEDPTRNKGDLNVLEYQYYNQPTPGIYSFHGGYVNSPEATITNKNNKQLENAGIRPTDRRSKSARDGNAGRMNVRADPLNQNGMITNVRSDCSRVDGRMNAANGGWTQNYVQAQFYQNNPYKGQLNPNTRRLDLAKNQLKNNPLAHTLSA